MTRPGGTAEVCHWQVLIVLLNSGGVNPPLVLVSTYGSSLDTALQTLPLIGRPTALPPLVMSCRPEILPGTV